MNANPSPAQTAVQNTLERLFGAVDARRFDLARAEMTDRIQVNYADLGGPSGEIDADALIEGWAAVLPTFDRTVHQLARWAVHVADARATATFDGIAVHIADEAAGTAYWTVFAGYDAELILMDATWKLARLHLSLYDEAGDRALPQRVGDRAVTPLSTRSGHPAVYAFFEALEAQDRTALEATLAATVQQEMPLAPEGFAPLVTGRDALLALYDTVLDRPQQYVRTVMATANPRVWIAAFEGQVTFTDGETYANRYVNLFEVDEHGLIVRIVEHFHPHILQNAWPGLQPPHHSVHASGASTKAVTVERVRFERDGVPLVGHLFRPAQTPAEDLPAVVVAGSWTSVKEQMPDVYASRLAERGVIAMTLDFTGFGESGGAHRQREDPASKIADLRAAVDVLMTTPGVDRSAVRGVGICAGAGYMAHAVASDRRLSGLILIAPWLHDEVLARSIYDLRPMGAEGLLAAADVAAAPTYVLAASELDPASAMYVPGDVFDYYLNPAKGAGPHYDNRFDVASWRPWITFDGLSAAKGLADTPVLVVHSEQGAIPDGARRFLNTLGSTAQAVWLDAFTQEDFYYAPDAVGAALDAVTPMATARPPRTP